MTERGDVVKKLDEGMHDVIMAAKAGDLDAKGKLSKRYRPFAKNFAIGLLTDRGFTKAAAAGLASDLASEVMERVLFGKKNARTGAHATPLIEAFAPSRSSLATYIGGLTKKVTMEAGRAAKRERAASSGREGKDGELDSVIDSTASAGPSPEDEVSAAEVEEVDVLDLTPAEARKVQEAIDSGELSAQDEARARALLDRWIGGSTKTKTERRADQREAIELALDSAGAGDGLSSEEATILAMRDERDENGKPKSYKQIAVELFGSDDKKSVQKVMVRLHRARKRLEEVTGMPLRGVDGDIGGIGYTARGRRRKNPADLSGEPDDMLYFESVEDLETLLEVGIIEPQEYRQGLEEILGRLVG